MHMIETQTCRLVHGTRCVKRHTHIGTTVPTTTVSRRASDS